MRVVKGGVLATVVITIMTIITNCGVCMSRGSVALSRLTLTGVRTLTRCGRISGSNCVYCAACASTS